MVAKPSKREAEAEPWADADDAGASFGKRSAFYGAALTLENRNNLHGHELASGYAISQPHPGFAGSYQQVSRLHSGLHYGGYYGKRSAEPFYGGVAVHPGHAVSSTQRSAQGLSLGYGIGYGHGFYGYGKRSALPFYALGRPSEISAPYPTAVGYGYQNTVFRARPYSQGK